jgi:hypothetical protein
MFCSSYLPAHMFSLIFIFNSWFITCLYRLNTMLNSSYFQYFSGHTTSHYFKKRLYTHIACGDVRVVFLFGFSWHLKMRLRCISNKGESYATKSQNTTLCFITLYVIKNSCHAIRTTTSPIKGEHALGYPVPKRIKH